MFTIQGIVRKGKSRGKDLGFPTANIGLNQEIPEGIYLSKVQIDNKEYFALTFVGKAETFDETTFQAESYILDFNKSIYGQTISIWLIKKIRDSKKFGSVDKLIEQMRKDEKVAREYFKKEK